MINNLAKILKQFQDKYYLNDKNDKNNNKLSLNNNNLIKLKIPKEDMSTFRTPKKQHTRGASSSKEGGDSRPNNQSAQIILPEMSTHLPQTKTRLICDRLQLTWKTRKRLLSTPPLPPITTKATEQPSPRWTNG